MTELDSVDNILCGQTVSLINMDVEGMEAEAIAGMAKTLRRHRPKLLIAGYHRSEDLWRLPLEVQAASYLAASVRMASLSSSSMPLHRAAALLGAIQPVDDMNGAAGEESHAHHHHNKSKGRHSTYLL